MAESHEDLRDRLTDVSDQLGDRIVTLLQEAVISGADKRPPEERILTRARAAVDKAVHLLEGLDADRQSD